jgi:hypothetical protein
MIRKIAIVCVAVIALAAVMGATGAVAKKKKKKQPLLQVGPYVGRTIPDGLELSITLNGDRTSGSIAYCSLVAPFIATGGTSFKSFAVNFVEPTTEDTIVASGSFSAKQRSVTGTLAPNGCTSAPQTFNLTK